MLTPVPPEELSNEVILFLSRFVSFSNDHQIAAVALWIFHTYVMDAAESTPYLQLHSAEKRSGKTRLLEVLELLVNQPWRLASPTGPVLFRRIAKGDTTLLLDEYDCIFNDKTGSYEDIRAILNSGHRRGSSVFRCAGEGTKMDVKEYPVFCAKALSGIGQPPDTVADRSIPIELKRQGTGKKVERFIRRRVEPKAAPIRVKLKEWADKSRDDLMNAEPKLPEALNDRAADGWEPLFAIADLIGGEWPQKARSAALVLHGGREDESCGVLLLNHIKDAFGDMDKLFTAELLMTLVAEENGLWGAWWGSDVELGKTKGPASKLARLLKPYGIKPKTVRVGDDTIKGYKRDQFKDAWERYLTTPLPLDTENRRNNVTAQVDTPVLPEQSKSEITENKGSEQGCDVVTLRNTKQTEQGEELEVCVSEYETTLAEVRRLQAKIDDEKIPLAEREQLLPELTRQSKRLSELQPDGTDDTEAGKPPSEKKEQETETMI